MVVVGHLLFWLGFVATAFVSLSQLDNETAPWETISWKWYAIMAGVSIGGIVCLRIAKSDTEGDEEKTEAEFSAVQSNLDRLVETVGDLKAQSHGQAHGIVDAIDETCVEPFANFAEARQSIAKRFGLAVYADVMTEFASAERYVNRSWSAAADGYMEESIASLTRAHRHLLKARELVTAAEQTTDSSE